MSVLGQCLTRIEAGLGGLGRLGLLAALAPGLTERTVRDQLAAVGLVATNELVELYGWHNGTRFAPETMLDDVHMFPGSYLLALEDSLANLLAFRPDSRWDSSWLPVFANGGGDFYISDLGQSAGPIRHFRIEETEHPVEFSSVGSMMATIEAAMERNVIFVEEGGYLEMDDHAFGDVAAEMSPDVEWWSR